MKELQPGIRLVQEKAIQLKRHPIFKKKAMQPKAVKSLPQQVTNQKRPLVSFPVRSHLEVLRQRTSEGWRRLESQAKRINQLSAELETAILEFKAIASEINPDWRTIQATQKSSHSADICKYCKVAVPHVETKPDGSFLLISKPVDLFQAEREATLLAQTLRQRSRKNRGRHQVKL
jgi:hypothetical protein